MSGANTNAGRKFYVCSTPKPNDLTLAEFAALTWVQVKGVGNLGETGSTTNILNYDTWDDDVTQKSKGMTNAGDPELEVRSDPNDAGQAIMLAGADTRFNYAFKVEGNDKPDADPESTPTIRYNRGMIAGPRQPNGRVEDFQLDVYTLALNQKQITVPAASGA